MPSGTRAKSGGSRYSATVTIIQGGGGITLFPILACLQCFTAKSVTMTPGVKFLAGAGTLPGPSTAQSFPAHQQVFAVLPPRAGGRQRTGPWSVPSTRRLSWGRHVAPFMASLLFSQWPRVGGSDHATLRCEVSAVFTVSGWRTARPPILRPSGVLTPHLGQVTLQDSHLGPVGCA